MAKDFAHNGPAITIVVIVASGLGVLMAYAIGRFWVVNNTRGHSDLEEGRNGELKQVDHMREVRNRNRETIAGAYGVRLGGSAPAYDTNAWQGAPRSGVNSYAYEDNSTYEWAPGAKGGHQAYAQESWDETGFDGYPEAGYASPMYEDPYSPGGPMKTPSRMSPAGSPMNPEMSRTPVQNIENHANEKQ